MTPAERRFKAAVKLLIQCGEYPSAPRIRTELGQPHYRGWRLDFLPPTDGTNTFQPEQYATQTNMLNGRECEWRREICHLLGFKLKGRNWGDPKRHADVVHRTEDFDQPRY